MFLMNCDCMQPHIRGNKTVSSPVVGTFCVVWYWEGGQVGKLENNGCGSRENGAEEWAIRGAPAD